MIYSIQKTVNGVKSENYHLNRFLSASAWSSLSSLIISAESTANDFTLCCSFHLHGNRFQVFLTKPLTSTYTLLFQNLSSIICCRYQVVLPCTCKEESKDINSWLHPHSKPTTYTSCESLRTYNWP